MVGVTHYVLPIEFIMTLTVSQFNKVNSMKLLAGYYKFSSYYNIFISGIRYKSHFMSFRILKNKLFMSILRIFHAYLQGNHFNVKISIKFLFKYALNLDYYIKRHSLNKFIIYVFCLFVFFHILARRYFWIIEEKILAN